MFFFYGLEQRNNNKIFANPEAKKIEKPDVWNTFL